MLTLSVTPVLSTTADFQPLLWGVALDGHPIDDQRLARVASAVLFSPQVVNFFLSWPRPGLSGEFPETSLDAIANRGAVPCLTWEPFFIEAGETVAVTLEQLQTGVYDDFLNTFASRMAKWKQPVIIRFAHEMNIERYHWGTTKERFGPDSPRIYRKMFRRVVRVFRANGADNVLWTFCPNAESLPNRSFDPTAGWNRASAYYPGDDVVDILGMDGYNWGKSQTLENAGWQSQWQPFEKIFQPLYNELRGMAPDKPIMVFETASVRGEIEGAKTRWITEMITTAKKWRLSGIVWFQVNKEVDWRFQSGIPPKDLLAVGIPAAPARQWAQWLLRRTKNQK